MSVSLAAEIWGLLRESIPYDDREQLADSLVGILVDSGYDLDDVRYAFRDDQDVQEAIKIYADDVGPEEEYVDYDTDEDEDSNW